MQTIFDVLEANGSDEPKQTPSALFYRHGLMCTVRQMQAILSSDAATMNVSPSKQAVLLVIPTSSSLFRKTVMPVCKGVTV